jgi:glycine/D-amino acid oxidase-like deaminating enzyme/Rieske Fe-S protein
MSLEFHSPKEAGVSFWRATAPASEAVTFPPLIEQTKHTDVVVVGAGITGLTAALELARHGKKVAVLEAKRIGAGTSGGTSAHLSSIPDLGLSKLISVTDINIAQKIIHGLQNAIRYIEHNENGESQFARVDGYLYRENEDQDSLDDDFKAATRLGMDIERTRDVPLPFSVIDGIRFKSQGIFHPMQYLFSLAKSIERVGGQIYEDTRVTHIENNSSLEETIVHCGARKIHCKHLILATHTPIGLQISLQSRLIPYLSFMIGIRQETGSSFSSSLFWDTNDPYHFIRRARDSKGELILIGGADEKVGEINDHKEPLENLKKYAQSHFPHSTIEYQWLEEFFEPADGLPYIGKLPLSDRIYTATGFSGNGLTFGTLGAQMLADEILGQNTFKDLHETFRPTRIRPIASAKNFLEENISVVRHLVGDRLHLSKESIDSIEVGQGRTIRVNGHIIAVYKDRDQRVHSLSATCTHAGCIVKWDHLNLSWECPCHGSRFSYSGEVINGPATHALKKVEITSSDEGNVLEFSTLSQS